MSGCEEPMIIVILAVSDIYVRSPESICQDESRFFAHFEGLALGPGWPSHFM